MAILDMFDKIDDIIYKPVETVCDWISAPLKGFEAKRERKKMDKAAEIEMGMRQQEAELQAYSARQQAELEVDQRRWNAEIDEMINSQEEARRDKFVESIKRYQIDLATASKDIVNSIGLMSLELRREANKLVMEKTQEYKQLQEDATSSAMKRLEEISERFSNNERVRTRMEDSVMNQLDSIINSADNFIKELAEDFKRLNKNTDDLMKMGMENVEKYLEPMKKNLYIDTQNNDADVKKLEDGSVIKCAYVEVNED